MPIRIKPGYKRMLLTLPEPLITQLTEAAWESRRTRQAHIITLLEEAVSASTAPTAA